MEVLRNESWYPLEQTLDLALREERFEVVYQPIYSATSDGPPVAYEALLRPGGDASPSFLLSLARSKNVLGQLEAKVLQRVHRESVALPAERLIFVNASRDALSSIRWLETITRFSHRLVIEVQDRHLRESDVELLGRFREHGMGIALDDLGQTLDDFSALRLVRPHYVKTDRPLVWEGQVQAIKHLLDAAHASGATLVVEGIETPEQDRMFRPFADLLQGFFYQRPCSIEEVIRREKDGYSAFDGSGSGIAALGMQISELSH